MKICYWNIGKKGLKSDVKFYEVVSNIASNLSLDLMCLSEFENFNDSVLLKNGYVPVDNAYCDKVKCYKKTHLNLVQIRIGDRYCFVTCKDINCLFVFLHAKDSINYDESDRLLRMNEIKSEIDSYVSNKNISVFIVGDFNCMPYDDSILNKNVLNCTLFRDLLKTKKGANERYYNPMLLLLSENNKIYGSYFNDSLKKNLRWYLLDQVIVNKYADNIIDYNSIKLLKKIGHISIIKKEKPNSELYSDHLPLYFEIKEDL